MHLDIDIGLLVFKAIIYYFGFSSVEKAHMAYCYIITGFITSLGIVTALGRVTILSEPFDRIGFRQMSLAGMDKGIKL